MASPNGIFHAFIRAMNAACFRWMSLLLWPVSALASAPAAAPAPIERYEVRLPVSEFRAGAARTTVAAAEPDVLSLATDFSHYAEFIKAFETSKVVGRAGKTTDVYLRVKILKGAAKIWAVVRFEPPARDGEEETITAHLVKGNVKRLDAIWHLRAVDAGHTRVALELLIVPDLPVPEPLVVPEVRDAAATAVRGLRDEAERRFFAN